jgi:hypothetical protein
MTSVSGITIPDSQLARDVTQFIRDTEDDLLFFHSSRVFFWGALKYGPRSPCIPRPAFRSTCIRK